MRVLLDCRMASWTGVGRYTVGLARALVARDDIELVQVAAANERPPVAGHQGARSVTAANHPFTLRGAREFGRIAATVDADVVHCAHFPTPRPISHPLVVTMHDVTPLNFPDVMPSLPKRLVYRYLNGRAAKHADRIITPSEFSAADVVRIFPAAAGKTRVTPEAADDFASGPPGLLDEALAEVADWPYVLSMGSTRASKDLPTLLRAFAIIARTDLMLRLLLVGDDQRAFVDDTLSDVPASIRDRVVFTGRLNDPALRTVMAGARVFALPSRYEGFGLPPLEAMSLGTPVVVADATSLPEVVGDAALRFAPGDVTGCAEAVGSVLRDPELGARLAEAGLVRAAAFSWVRTADLTVAVYREALIGDEGHPGCDDADVDAGAADAVDPRAADGDLSPER